MRLTDSRVRTDPALGRVLPLHCRLFPRRHLVAPHPERCNWTARRTLLSLRRACCLSVRVVVGCSHSGLVLMSRRNRRMAWGAHSASSQTRIAHPCQECQDTKTHHLVSWQREHRPTLSARRVLKEQHTMKIALAMVAGFLNRVERTCITALGCEWCCSVTRRLLDTYTMSCGCHFPALHRAVTSAQLGPTSRTISSSYLLKLQSRGSS